MISHTDTAVDLRDSLVEYDTRIAIKYYSIYQLLMRQADKRGPGLLWVSRGGWLGREKGEDTAEKKMTIDNYEVLTNGSFSTNNSGS